ncbi:uncharacterized protein LOC135117540 [Helicoverpa armigera]|uniref:uncharacterized protein LOC135117540 n=1 Tax=Helicoverpa armigera TaxID=29058 RepID=UPI0030830952
MYKQLARAAGASWGLQPEIIRTIYTAAVEPTILYAASAWAPAANKLGVQKQLNVVQRGFAQKLCKAYRTVSLNSALLLAGILPLDIRIREAASLYEAKGGGPQPTLGDREIERMASALEAPHPAKLVTLQYDSIADDEEYRNRSEEFAVRIFTDGSKIQGKVGAALSLWDSTTETKALKLTLPSYCTVYQAELLALQKAATEALKRRENTFGIFSDSMAALQTVTNVSAPHPLAVETRDTIRRCKLQNKSVSLFWIKAHTGLEGNERADQLAKEAALKSKKKPDYDLCPISFVKRQIRMRSLDEWNGKYKAGETASGTKLFFPDAISAYGIVRKIDLTYIRTQIFTGHGGFSSYLTRFKCKENSSCACEPGVEETVAHILLECPITERARFETEQELTMSLTATNLPFLMRDKKDRPKFLDYCEKIVSLVISRNKL